MQLQEERDTLQKKLIFSENKNRRLEFELQKMSQGSPPVKALQDQLAALKTKYEEAVTSCSLIKNQYDGAREQLQKRDVIASLQQRLDTEKDWKKIKASLHHQSSEDKWCKEVSQLKELLKQKDQEVQRLTKKRQRRTKAFCDIFYLLTVNQAELQKSNHKCQTLEEKLEKTLKEGEKLKELFKKQLVESEIKDKNGLCDLNDQGEAKALQGMERQSKLEETPLKKEGGYHQLLFVNIPSRMSW